jgi:hypothetical protein
MFGQEVIGHSSGDTSPLESLFRRVKKLEAPEEPPLAALHFGVKSIQPIRVKAALHDVT